MDKDNISAYFQFFNEVGIVEQLSRNMFETKLPDGILVSHFGVLNNLTRVRDGRTPLELAEAFQVPKTTMTYTLAGLEKHGMVEIRKNPEDGRSKQVWITDKGRKFREEAVFLLAPEIAEFAQRFPAEMIIEMLPKLVAIREYLDQARD